VALKKVDGVENADVSYEAGSAIVTFDPDVTSPAEFIGELTRLTGFTAEIVEMTGADSAATSNGSQ
jgi:copper chaperone CopZ